MGTLTDRLHESLHSRSPPPTYRPRACACDLTTTSCRGDGFDVRTFAHDRRYGFVQADGDVQVFGFGRRALRSEIPPAGDGGGVIHEGFVPGSTTGG